MRVGLRVLYRLLETSVASRLVRGGVWALAQVTRSPSEGWLSALDRRFVRSGWPGHGAHWINLHVSRFLTRVRRDMRAPAPVPRQPPRQGAPLRVGLIGRFVGLLGFPPELFAARPGDVHLTVFDVPYNGRRAEYLNASVDTYCAVDLDGAGSQTRDAAHAITVADLDLLVNVNWKPDAHALLDVVETRCVANYCVGSDLLHHPRVDFELLWQLQADNEIRDGRIWCTQSELPVGSPFVFQISGLYDRRGLPAERLRPWHEREPLIVTHGSLYKFAATSFTDCLLDVLESDSDVQWVLVGKDNGRALASIERMARARGLSSRVHYEGEFSSLRNAQGVVDDPRWPHVQDLLRRARLAPDPFPMGSGSARFEAYWLGAPSPHMGIRTRTSRGLASCDLPVLSVPAATAESVADYRALCLRCLHDGRFGDSIQREQQLAAVHASDPDRWWRELEAAYRTWQRRSLAS